MISGGDTVGEVAVSVDALAAARRPEALRVVRLEILGKSYQGEVYRRAPDGEITVRVVKVEGARAGEAYDCWVDAGGHMHCTCPDYVYRRDGLTNLPCKHGARLLATGIFNSEGPCST